MTRRDFVSAIVEYLGHQGMVIQRSTVDDILGASFEIIEDQIGQQRQVTLRGFGRFYGRLVAAHSSVDPRNPAARISVPARIQPRFTPAGSLKTRINT